MFKEELRNLFDTQELLECSPEKFIFEGIVRNIEKLDFFNFFYVL